MKNTKQCSKCGGNEILRIRGEVGAYGSGNNIRVGWTNFSAVAVTRFVCGKCGFSEEWIESPKDIATLKRKFGTNA